MNGYLTNYRMKKVKHNSTHSNSINTISYGAINTLNLDEVSDHIARVSDQCRGGLVGYDAALTQLRSGVRFPSTVFFLCFCFCSRIYSNNYLWWLVGLQLF